MIARVAKEAKISKAAAGRAINGAFDVITKALKKGDHLILPGFGSFSVAKRRARTGTNPQTRKPLKIAARKVAKFRASDALKKSIQ